MKMNDSFNFKQRFEIVTSPQMQIGILNVIETLEFNKTQQYRSGQKYFYR